MSIERWAKAIRDHRARRARQRHGTRVETYTCPRCNGDGALLEWSEGQVGGDHETYTCPDCDGVGEQERHAPTPRAKKADDA